MQSLLHEARTKCRCCFSFPSSFEFRARKIFHAFYFKMWSGVGRFGMNERAWYELYKWILGSQRSWCEIVWRIKSISLFSSQWSRHAGWRQSSVVSKFDTCHGRHWRGRKQKFLGKNHNFYLLFVEPLFRATFNHKLQNCIDTARPCLMY